MYTCRDGHERWNLEEPDLEDSSANARKDVIDGINSSRSRRGQIAKCVGTALSLCGKNLAVN